MRPSTSLFLSVPLLVVLASIGCNAPAEGELVEARSAPLVDDIKSMVREPDGTFTVTCRDGSVERRITSSDLVAQRVCNRNGDTPGPGTCVAGTSWECDDPGEHWTGSKCCVANATCADGTSWECDEKGEHWTGEKCCVENTRECVAGTSWECDDRGEHWTGTSCCVEDALCADGTSWECDDPGEHWTGEKCCVEKAAACDEGTAWECDDKGEHWTGAKCCVTR